MTAFLWPGAMERLRAKFESELRPGTRVVSHHHAIPGGRRRAVYAPNDVFFYRWPEAQGVPAPLRVGLEPEADPEQEHSDYQEPSREPTCVRAETALVDLFGGHR